MVSDGRGLGAVGPRDSWGQPSISRLKTEGEFPRTCSWGVMWLFLSGFSLIHILSSFFQV